ncbi:sulfatase family protein [Brachybacterium sillae]|uniref:sulfatase family protein n=1 Tax=Brachybacterium sillae TaxID=2810536 RepID=UPI00217D0371|nr:sulfatase [Brachybacterium sillae]
MVLSDDHAAAAISAYGGGLNSTPHLDRLAQEGARLDAMLCTNSVCTPSRASILTGTYSHVHGAATIYTEFDHRLPTFPQVPHDHGYATALFGKWHLGESEQALPRGFDAWRIFPGQGEYHDPVMIGPEGRAVVPGYATDIVTDMSLDWLREQRRENPQQPFCLLVHHKAPQRNWQPHDRHRHLYPAGSIPEPETLFDDHASRSRQMREVRMTIADDLTENDLKEPLPPELQGEENREARTHRNYQLYLRDYLQTVQAVDDSMGRLLDELDAQGLAENTLVIYLSDQGFFLGEHGWYDKRLMFDESLRMPMMVRWPREVPAGGVVGALATNVDIAATLLEATGLDPQAELPAQQGRRLLPLLRGTVPADWPTAMYYRYWEHLDCDHRAPAHYGVRTARYTYIDCYGAGMGAAGSSDEIVPQEFELYDREVDPLELHNVVDDPAYAPVVAELRAELARLQVELGDEPYRGPDTPRPEWGPHA